MTEESTVGGKQTSLCDVLASQLRVLVAAGADERLIKEYTSLLKLVKSRGISELGNDLAPNKSQVSKQKRHEIADQEIETASLERLSEFVADESVGRRSLERIAINRFGVPSGSMRSFSNRRLLLDKLRALIRNEQAHETIKRVAGRQGDQET